MSFDISSLNDQNNIIGISDLIKSTDNNPDRIEKIKKIENEVIKNVYDMDIKSEYNFKDEYEKELQKLTNNYNKYKNDIKDLDNLSDVNIEKYKKSNKKENKNNNHKHSSKTNDIDMLEDDDYDDDIFCDDTLEKKNIYHYDDKKKSQNKSTTKDKFGSSDKINNNSSDKFVSSSDKFVSEDINFQRLTKEQQIQQHMDDVIKSMNNNSFQNDTFDIDKEKEEDDKIAIIEQIDTLKEILTNDSINISRIPEVTPSTSIKELKSILKILKLKNDRNRLCSLTEEGILMGATSLEYLFDGKKEYFGYKPDLVGWPDTVKIKLRRMRYETSSFASGIMKNYNLGIGTRLALELIPSMFLYNRIKNTNKNINDTRFTDAINDLNKME